MLSELTVFVLARVALNMRLTLSLIRVSLCIGVGYASLAQSKILRV